MIIIKESAMKEIKVVKIQNSMIVKLLGSQIKNKFSIKFFW